MEYIIVYVIRIEEKKLQEASYYFRICMQLLKLNTQNKSKQN